MKQHYIDATLQMISEGKEISSILDGLQKIMEQKGHTSLFAAVLRGVLRVLETQKSTGTVVYVAKAGDETELADTIKAALAELEAVGEPTVVVDETLVGGAVVQSNNFVLDRSYKTALINLYRSVTK